MTHLSGMSDVGVKFSSPNLEIGLWESEPRYKWFDPLSILYPILQVDAGCPLLNDALRIESSTLTNAPLPLKSTAERNVLGGMLRRTSMETSQTLSGLPGRPSFTQGFLFWSFLSPGCSFIKDNARNHSVLDGVF